ncbi:ankyrin repeat domain-containing protein [Hydrogenophaga sp.]|uniref:ankyrin repeat domain-containing protein n=1 Tax=Hydrogenophaga sp. TaxID=1904254 RepID=UPI002727E898|nr:ankyrin repeat domain-containing protein [Hydrogenophaga sp.]MDO8906082.1 ankyrin repeat domain-containing protein [Hydrogenophaga sp.]
MFTNCLRFIRKTFVFTGLFFLSLCAFASSYEAFFEAVQNDNESAVIGLTLRQFDLNTLNPDGEHALVIAIRSGSVKVANFLLDQKAVKVEVRNRHGESPLMMAALKGQLALAKRLIERKAEVNKPGWTPLHYAATNADPVSVEMTRLMLEHHAFIDAVSPNRTTPLMMAAHYGHPDVVKLLLEEGADATARNEKGLTAIDFARGANRPAVVNIIASRQRNQQPRGTW